MDTPSRTNNAFQPSNKIRKSPEKNSHPLKKGLTNGGVMVQRMHRSNENGLTNGLRAQGGALSSNQDGLTNGLSNPPILPELSRRRRKPRNGRKWALLLGVIFIVVILVLSILTSMGMIGGPYKGAIRVDGETSDWHPDWITPCGGPPLSNRNVEIVSTGAVVDGQDIALYLKVKGRILSGGAPTNMSLDTLHIFIDADMNPSTGYRISGIGADWRVKIDGWDNKIESNELLRFNDLKNQNNWNSFSRDGTVSAAVGESEMELEVRMGSSDSSAPKAAILFALQGWNGSMGYSPIISTSQPVINVVQRSLVQHSILNLGEQVDALEISFFPTRDVSITSIEFNHSAVLKENGAAITFPLALKKGEKRTFIAEAEIPSNTTLGSIFQLAL
ncbi:MAG: hypothetical protein AB1665_09335, partial [Candidatus Thermoplasmatota archaeon]